MGRERRKRERKSEGGGKARKEGRERQTNGGLRLVRRKREDGRR